MLNNIYTCYHLSRDDQYSSYNNDPVNWWP